jgi:hypothetical protein
MIRELQLRRPATEPDPVLQEWRLLVALVDGMAVIDRADVEDGHGTAASVVSDLARLLDACVVTEEGVVLLVGAPSPHGGHQARTRRGQTHHNLNKESCR